MGEQEVFVFQRRYTDGQQAHEEMCNVTNHRGNAHQNPNKTAPHTCQNGYHRKEYKQVLAWMWRKGDLCTLLVGI